MTTSLYFIEPAQSCHLPLLSDIEIAAASIFPPGSLPDWARQESTPVELLAEGVHDGRLWVVLGKNGDDPASPVGYALMRVLSGLALLAQIDVHPEHARQGLGTRLIQKAAQKAEQEGHDALFLTTFEHIAWNAPFYVRLGFRILHFDEQPPVIRETLEQERRAGLERRVAMILPLKRR